MLRLLRRKGSTLFSLSDRSQNLMLPVELPKTVSDYFEELGVDLI